MVVVVGVLGLLGSAVLGSVQSGYGAKRQFSIDSTVENLIRNQMEYVFEQQYEQPGEAYLTIASPSGFSVTADSLLYDASSVDILRWYPKTRQLAKRESSS